MRSAVAPLVVLLLAATASAQPAQPEPRVVVVTIDAKTLTALGPFGGAYRAHHANLIKALNRSGARAIAFDVYFPDNPDHTLGTAALARAAADSRAPVVVAELTELDPDGREVVLPNAAVIRDDPRIREGAIMARDELLLERGADGEVEARTGGRTIVARSGGNDALVIELARAAGLLEPADFERLGLIEPVVTGATLGRDGAVREERTPALRPQLGDPAALERVSYVDVLRGRLDLRGALVLVGMDDGQNDVVEQPDPARPELTNVSGVYLHAFALRRALEARARDLARGPARTPGLVGALGR
jgi:hypothetical protein